MVSGHTAGAGQGSQTIHVRFPPSPTRLPLRLTMLLLQYGGECFYGKDLGAAIANGPSTACTMTCSADTSKICGGNNANSIYTVV